MVDDYLGPLGGKSLSNSTPNAPGRACDNGNFVF
jgi:hypothetical protein